MNPFNLKKVTGTEYYSTKAALYESVANPKYIISTQYYNTKLEKDCRLYSALESANEMYLKFVINPQIKPTERCFYEVAPGERLSKMRFDIERECESLEERTAYEGKLLRSIIRAIGKTSPEYLDEDGYLTEARVYQSHRDFKVSYHVVLLNVVGTNLALKEYYYRVLENVSDAYKSNIDKAVYSSFQQFRLYGSTKLGKIANKKLWIGEVNVKDRYKYKSPKEPKSRLEDIAEFQKSLLSMVPANPIILKTTSVKPEHLDTSVSLSDLKVELDDLQNVLSSFGGLKIGSEKDNIISVENKGGYDCPVCKRVHEHENPYLVITEESVLFFCRRSDSNVPKTIWQNKKVAKKVKSVKTSETTETVSTSKVTRNKKKKLIISSLTETTTKTRRLKIRYQ